MGIIDKSAIITEHKLSEKDTGSPEVQVALLTARISQLTAHLKMHRKDFHSRRGLVAMASRRRRLLAYVKRNDAGRYSAIVKNLGLRK
ncbi:MAG: 30S ribosomal protein S15 [Puniceicoccales bacterium]|jgi:small subunit ribosomal protein S15|nr:30S ribosomal protein S15 [Puniceicoccales bacterium]